MPMLEPVPLILTAIEEKRVIRLLYHQRLRIVEPHDHGILKGSVQLLGYQIAGASSRSLPNWLLMKTDEISVLTLLEQTFAGGRPTSSGNHIKWDKLFIRVKPAPIHVAAKSK
jgi:predicted DNA-binding transcriptional regulator YafY